MKWPIFVIYKNIANKNCELSDFWASFYALNSLFHWIYLKKVKIQGQQPKIITLHTL